MGAILPSFFSSNEICILNYPEVIWTQNPCISRPYCTITVEHGQKITQNFLGEHKVITPEQQFLGLILSFFMHLRWPWLSRFFCLDAVEAI